MYPNDPVTTAYLNRFHAVERDAHAELRRIARDARRVRKAETRQPPSGPRRRHVWTRRRTAVASA